MSASISIWELHHLKCILQVIYWFICCCRLLCFQVLIQYVLSHCRVQRYSERTANASWKVALTLSETLKEAGKRGRWEQVSRQVHIKPLMWENIWLFMFFLDRLFYIKYLLLRLICDNFCYKCSISQDKEKMRVLKCRTVTWRGELVRSSPEQRTDHFCF